MSASATRQAAGATGEAPFRFLLTHRRRTQGFRETLAEPGDGKAGVSVAVDAPHLTMLWIPPGRFWMGSPADETGRSEAEGPQHLVQLQGFFMSQTLITQAQWRALAMGKPAKSGQERLTKLDPDPSGFNGDQRPVEQVSWHEAMEFCRRLSQRTGRHYTLPSEAQWEYACRAGTTTPFHFGETISAELANYDASKVYADGKRGEHRWQTTEVASFPANPWGLHDMHGNVWEWCLDHWHQNYEGAPEHGGAWLDEDVKENQEQKGRLLRGGSWNDHPGFCRSAFRFTNHPGRRNLSIGFRVCCLPQD
jgi:formylglycine-generating enzyme required for sulfatase activity